MFFFFFLKKKEKRWLPKPPMKGISELFRPSRKRRSDETKQSDLVLPEGLCRRFSLVEIKTALPITSMNTS